MSIQSANHDAAIPPRPRLQFNVAHLMLLPLLMVVVLVVIDWKLEVPRFGWSEQHPMTLDFEVSDGSTARPLEGVTIEILTPSGQRRASGQTRADGSASLTGPVTVSGSSTLFRKLNDARVESFHFTLSKSGYHTINASHTYSYYYGSKMPRPRFRWGLTPVPPLPAVAAPK